MKNELVKLCIDTVRGNVQNYSAQDANSVIRKAFVDLLGTDKPDYRTFRAHKNEIFEIIEDSLDQLMVDGLEKNTFFQQFVEYRDLNLGDTNEFFVEDKSVLSVSELAAGTWNVKRQKLDIGDSFTVKTKTFGIAIYADFLRVLAGRMDWAAFVAKVDEALRMKMATDIYTNFMGVSTYLPAEFKASGTYSEAQMENIVGHVQASNNYAPLVIAGTRKALKNIIGAYSGANSFLVSENMKNQLNSTGLINVWQGIPLFEIPQVHAANTFNFAIDDKKLLILPGNTKPVKVIREGETIIRENSDGMKNMDMSMDYTLITNYGVACLFNVMFGCYDLA